LNIKTDSQNLPIGLTMGDPAGISPDITILSWALRDQLKLPNFIYFGSDDLLQRRAEILKIKIKTKKVNDLNNYNVSKDSDALMVYDIPIFEEKIGQYDKKNNQFIIDSIVCARQKISENKISAIVTNPVNKKSLSYLGCQYHGQTELFSFLDNNKTPVMLLASDKLKVVPLTRHLPLAKVSNTITKELIITTSKILGNSLKNYFQISNPKIFLTGLNPHAGDGGLCGMEEIKIIEPAILELQKTGMNISGPFSADSLFNENNLSTYDAVICMYHDQALIPIKTISPFSAVNITLGLTTLRTSPDHGPAYLLAGTGKAHPESLIRAINMANSMVRNHSKGNFKDFRI